MWAEVSLREISRSGISKSKSKYISNFTGSFLKGRTILDSHLKHMRMLVCLDFSNMIVSSVNLICISLIITREAENLLMFESYFYFSSCESAVHVFALPCTEMVVLSPPSIFRSNIYTSEVSFLPEI